MNNSIVRYAYFALALAMSPGLIAPCRADLIVDIGNITIDARSTGSIPVYVYSSDGTEIGVAGFQLGFRITDISSPGSPASGILTFLPSFDPLAPSSSVRQTNSEQSRLDYIFAGRSSVGNFAATTDTADPGRLTSEDSTLNLDPFGFTNVPVTGPVLLARLELSQTQSLDTELSRGQYRVELVSSESRFYDANLDTAFNPAFTLPFSTNPGLVTVSNVPEPSGIILVLAVLACLVNRKHRPANDNVSIDWIPIVPID